MLLFILFCVNLSFGGGFYHPNDTAQHSDLFKTASEVAGTQATRLETHASGIAVALNRYEEALDYLPIQPEHQTYFLATRTTFNREFAVASAFVHTMLDDFDNEFTTALRAALVKEPELTICVAQRPVGGRTLPGIRPRLEANPECKGTNTNKTLASHMDSDTGLQTAIKEILDLKWPQVSRPETAQAPSGEGSIWIDALAFFEQLDRSTTRRIQKEDAVARDDVLLEEEDSKNPKAREEALQQSRAISKATRSKRTAFAAPILEAIRTYNDKAAKKGLPTYALCPTPMMLGGCTGPQASKEQLNVILTDKRIQKALP